MGILDRYARKPIGEKRTKTVSTKLTEEEYRSFNSYIEARGLTTSEAIRWLILEELGLGIEVKRSSTLETKIDQGKSMSTSVDKGKLLSTEVAATSLKPAKTHKKTLPPRFTYRPWEVKGKLPCVICGNWYQSATFSGRHAKEHGFIDTKDYFVKKLEEINRMYKEMTGNEPEYDPKMIK